MGDIVSSESSLFWKLSVPPTKFDGYFCESVTREFESDPEPCSLQDHFWKCSFTENMINGVATIDIVIQRIMIKSSSSSSEGGGGESPSGRRGEPSSSSFSTQQQQEQQQQGDQPQEREQEQGREHGQQHASDSMPAPIHYKTIAMHTPKTLAPLMSMFLDVELEAEAIRHRGRYEFEIVLSEEISSYMNPSPSSCHRVTDSLYHEIVATSQPDTSSADVWFEFYPPPSGSPSSLDPTSILLPVEERSHTSEEHRHQQWQQAEGGKHHDGSAVVVVGAHWEKLKKYPYFADWIQRERQRQEGQRRRQLEEEWRIHQEHNQSRQQQQEQYYQQQHQYYQQQAQPYNPWWHAGQPYGPPPPEYPRGELEDPQQRHAWIEQPLPHYPSHHGGQQQHYQDPQQQQQFQRSEYHPREIPTYFQPLHGSAASSSSSSSSSAPRHPNSRPSHQQHGLPVRSASSHSSSHPHSRHHHHQGRQIDPPPLPPPPALRIPVTQISLGTFQVFLQYIYTGSIGLSENQIHDIDTYWNDHPEDHLAPQEDKNPLNEEDMPSLTSLLAYYRARDRAKEFRGGGGGGGSGDRKFEPRPPILLSPLGHGFGYESGNADQQPHQQPHQEQQTRGEGEEASGEGEKDVQAWSEVPDCEQPRTTIKDLFSMRDIYTFTTASVQTAWIPCSPRDRRKGFRDSQPPPPPPPAPTSHHWQPAEGGKEMEEGRQGGGPSGRQQGRGQGRGRSGGHRGGRGRGRGRGGGEQEHGTSSSATTSSRGTGEPATGISNPENDPSSSSSTTSPPTTGSTLLPHPPNHGLPVPHIRPTCSWESLLLFANLIHLQDLETTALKAIKYHCQMLASRALINNNVMAEVAHNGFDRSNLDLQLVLGERIMLSLLKLYRLPGLRVHSEGVQVLHGGGDGGGGGGPGGGGGGGKGKGAGRGSSDPESCEGGEGGSSRSGSKKLQPAQSVPMGLQTQMEERFRHQKEDQQQQAEEEEKERAKSHNDDNAKDDGRKQEEGHLGTIQASSSSSSSTARTRGGSGAGSRRYSGRRQGHGQGQGQGQGRGGFQATRGECSVTTTTSSSSSSSSRQHTFSTEGAHEPMSSTSTSASASTRTRTRASSGSNTQGQSRSGSGTGGGHTEREREHGEDEDASGGGEGEEGEETIASPLELFDHPECEDALEALCKDLRERFLSIREVMDRGSSA
ncbi:hypothetical protein BGW39_011443 [Mortierella sp. 14UC]|nr:hypothetical protein BGW39_011443 [Mortierella sp. 14UC]